MTLSQQLILIFSALGALNGLVLSTYFLWPQENRRLSDYFLGALLLMLSVRILKSVLLFFNPALFQLFVQIGLSACALIGPFLYLYVRSMLRPTPVFKQRWWWHLMPSLLLIGWLAINYPYTGPPNSWGPYYPTIHRLWFSFLFLAAIELRMQIIQLFTLPRSLADEDKWLLNVFFGVLLIFVAYVTSPFTSYIVGALSFSFLLYLAVLLRVFRGQQRSIAHDEPLRYANSSLQVSDAKSLVLKLEEQMQKNQYFLDAELTLVRLSKHLDCSSKDLSQAINQVLSKNYSKYVAQLRVEHAKQLLTNAELAHYKIAAIAYDSGFNSLSSFNTTFKRITGMTPRAYRENGMSTS